VPLEVGRVALHQISFPHIKGPTGDDSFREILGAFDNAAVQGVGAFIFEYSFGIFSFEYTQVIVLTNLLQPANTSERPGLFGIAIQPT
jgi:hypothetical protein